MEFEIIVLIINIIITAKKGEKAPADPWDGRRLEWSISSPPSYYNFKQLPLTRGLDPLWLEKTEGTGEMTPAERLDEIHMPNNSCLPFLMSGGCFIVGYGFIYQTDHPLGYIALYGGMAFAIATMIVRSVKDDLGYHIPVEELEKEDD